MYCSLKNKEVDLEIIQVLLMKSGDKTIRKCNQIRCMNNTNDECLCNKLMDKKNI